MLEQQLEDNRDRLSNNDLLWIAVVCGATVFWTATFCYGGVFIYARRKLHN